MHYRSATACDVEAIAALHTESWRRNYRGAFSDAFLDGDLLADRLTTWRDRLTRPGPAQLTIVAERAGEVTGFVHTILRADATWGALVDNLHVAHALRRRGIGRELMAGAAEAVLGRTPRSGLFLWVLEQNKAAQAFYASLGGSCVERGIATPPGGGSPARLRMAWSDPSALARQVTPSAASSPQPLPPQR